MLESIDPEHSTECCVFRLSVLLDDKENILPNARADDNDARYMAYMLGGMHPIKNLGQPMTAERLEKQYIDSIFDAKPNLDTRWRGRFWGSTFQVFYSSLDEETTKAEVCYWHCRLIACGERDEKTEHRILLSCKFFGPLKRLQRLTCSNFEQNGTCPKLAQNEACPKRAPNGACSQLTQNDTVGDEYKFCQDLASEAVNEGLHGLRTPSARNLNEENLPNGENLPVFCRKALSNLCIRGYFDIVYDAEEQSARAIQI